MPGSSAKYDAIILGAGAAGLYCAGIAAQRGRSILLIDHAQRPGRKILISGGGRCNFTNLEGDRPERYLSQNPHFAKSALRRHRPQAFIALVEKYDIAWHEKTLGQLFCDGSARQIVDLLVTECRKGDVRLELGSSVREISHREESYEVRFGADAVAVAPSLVVATGGPSIPKMGATGLAYEIARQFGVPVETPRPALVPLKLPEGDLDFGGLTGLSADVVARCGKAAFREAALFTHRGLSGPAILQVSSYWRPGEAISIDFLPGCADGFLTEAKRTQPKSGLTSALQTVLPARLARLLAERVELSNAGKPLEFANRPDRELRGLEARLRDWTFLPSGTEGFAKAEVTAGGVSTAALSSRTLETQEVPGLYFIGEAVDVTGWLGGYNFQWAWSSGWACAQALVDRSQR